MVILVLIIIIIIVIVVFSKKNTETINSNIFDDIDRNIELEKKRLFEEYYSKYKNYEISTLEDMIEFGRKNSYKDYTLDDKMKFKACKTLIREKFFNK